ncbi:MAG: hypothetical protein OXK77_12615 [Gemmatimonadota bacterium]|nr:hypothetical protein [Gemmatimonadota bacterium]MDE2864092.1 hypothetical protein [Gemmatimonadota bacterium]
MRWPWSKRETRASGGDFADAVVRLLEARAAGKAADAGSTAAVEAASGALSRAMASARVEGAPHVREAVTGPFLAQVGRDLIRSGQSMHVIDVDRSGRVSLLPCSSWNFHGDAHPDTWRVQATCYGPSTSTTLHLPFSGVVFVKWGSGPGQPYTGTGPLSWAHTTARLQSETERSLADEMGGPLAQLLAIPTDGGDDSEDDPLKLLKADIRTARGKALLVETVMAGHGEGRGAAPQRDWIPSRLGPMPPESMARIQEQAFAAVLAATGTPPGLFESGADGTSQREALRRWHLGTVLPHARLLQDELAAKLEGDVELTFDSYPLDIAGRAQSFGRLTSGDQALDRERALKIVGLGDG